MKLTALNYEQTGVRFDILKPGDHFLYNNKLWVKIKMSGSDGFDYYAVDMSGDYHFPQHAEHMRNCIKVRVEEIKYVI